MDAAVAEEEEREEDGGGGGEVHWSERRKGGKSLRSRCLG